MKYLILCILVCGLFVSSHGQTADFTSALDPSTGCVPLEVDLIDISSGNPTSWTWTITGPENFTSSIQNPGFTFQFAGTYTVTLELNNGSIATEQINTYVPPVADFIANITQGCAPLNVCFEDLSTEGSGTIIDWFWEPGVPPALTGPTPCLTYTEKNIFDVELLIEDINGCQSSVEFLDYITINRAPEPSFTVEPGGGCDVPLTVDVTNTSLNQTGATYDWTFVSGNPATFSGYNPPDVNYNVDGSHDIILSTTDNGDCPESYTLEDAVVIEILVADFTISDDTPCEGQNVTFTDNSNITGLSYQWYINNNAVGDDDPVLTTSFLTQGGRNISLVVSSQDGLCSDSVSYPITVLEGVFVDITVDNSTSCTAPFTVNFSAIANDAVSWEWTFPPSAIPQTSNLENPTVTFTQPGLFDVTLTVEVANGCEGTIIANNIVGITEDLNLNINSNAQDDEGCVPLDICFVLSGNIPNDVTIASIDWTTTGGIPNGGPGSPIEFCTRYDNVGTYDVVADITFTGGCLPQTIDLEVNVGDLPVLTATIDPDTICLNEPVTGCATSTLDNTQFDWYFEPPGGYVDGGIGTSGCISYLYATEWQQPWNVLMIGDNNGCKDTVIVPVMVDPPAAQFQWLTDCDNPTEITFLPNIPQGLFTTQLDWYIDDDRSNPVHSATNIGNGDFTYDFGTIDIYQVTLIVTSNLTGCTDSQTTTIDLLNAIPDVGVTPGAACPGDLIIYPDLTDYNFFHWRWVWGDGDTSTIIDFESNHRFDAPGIYESYIIGFSNFFNCWDTLGPIEVYIGGGDAVIDGVLGSCYAPLTTTYNANSSEFIFGVETADWVVELDTGPPADEVFGSMTAGPYTYNNNGIYNVTMTAYDSIGCADDTFARVLVGDPLAQFISDVQNICPGDTVRFKNQSLGGNLSYLWDFGDGNTSSAQDPVHVYGLTGTYTVSLTIVDTVDDCTHTETKPLYINAVGTGFSFNVLEPNEKECPPLFVEFELSPPATLDQLDFIKWYFEESSETSYSGDVLLQNTTGQNLYLQGGPDGDGWYDVALVIQVGSCRDSIYCDSCVFVGGQRGNFSFDPDTFCAPGDVNFWQVDVDRTDSIFWDFGGGNFLDAPVNIDNFSIEYSIPGRYDPVILLKNEDCPPILVDPSRSILVSDIIADGWVDKVYLCDEGDIEFRDSSQVLADTATGDFISFLEWDFGDGTVSNESDPIHNYSGITGQVDIHLELLTDFGCQDDTTFSIDIYVTPDGNVDGPKSICIGESVQLNASGAPNYLWDPAIFVTDPTSPTPIAFPDDSTTFMVIMYNDILCPDTGFVRVNVLREVDGVAGPDAEICIGQSVQLEVIPLVTSIDGTTTYTWTPPTGLSDPNVQDPIASPDISIIYTVTMSSGNCLPDQMNVLVEVGGTPFVNAGPDQFISSGESADLFAFSPNLVTYTWFDLEGNFISNNQGITVSPQSSTTYVVEVGNEACRDIDSVDILILESCDQGRAVVPNVFTPNGDGVNDELKVIPGLGVTEIKLFRIFNRWGELVFEAESESVIWDGTQSGRLLDPGVFVYYIELVCANNEKSIRKGNITLLK